MECRRDGIRGFSTNSFAFDGLSSGSVLSPSFVAVDEFFLSDGDDELMAIGWIPEGTGTVNTQ
jgi:hypothetical protein